MSSSEQVIVVGAGPVGSITALRLSQLGVPVVLLESLPNTPTGHRAATTHSSTLDLLDKVGLSSQILEAGLKAQYFQYRNLDNNEVFAEFDFSLLEDETNHPYAIQLEQHKTVEIALNEARKYSNFTLLREHIVSKVDNKEEMVEVTIDLPNNEVKKICGRFLIGCDGGKSYIRKSQGIDFPGFTWEERFLILASYFDYEKADNYRYRNYLSGKETWCSVFKIPGPKGSGMWRNLFPVTQDISEREVISDGYVNNQIKSCFPYIDKIDVVDKNLYSVHQRVANKFTKGRVILAGDAAHVNNPLGGMGMNSGIHDGLNIAEKISKLWNNSSLDFDKILSLYDRQRRPLAKKYVQAQSIENKKTLQSSESNKSEDKYDNLKRISSNKNLQKSFLLKASLIDMVRESDSII